MNNAIGICAGVVLGVLAVLLFLPSEARQDALFRLREMAGIIQMAVPEGASAGKEEAVLPASATAALPREDLTAKSRQPAEAKTRKETTAGSEGSRDFTDADVKNILMELDKDLTADDTETAAVDDSGEGQEL